jgi:2,3-bisphosphoglycerate-independent phosphoglycerate mutase
MAVDAKKPGPTLLIVRDGWGRNPNKEHDAFNAVKLAATPCCNALLREYPWTLIHTSGEDVGLPQDTMGNSEVGHQNLGAGRVVYQESVRITVAIREGEFYENATLVDAVRQAKASGRSVHLMGIGSDVGVHGLLQHLFGCLELCRRQGMPRERVFIHCFTDGRDSGPYTGKAFLEAIDARCREIGVGRISSVVGRYYAMDRDNRWERVEKAYRLLTEGCYAPEVGNFRTAGEAVQEYYDNPANDSQQGDEFILPRTVAPDGDPTPSRIADGDAVIFYNYRGDRPREITRAFVLPNELWAKVAPSPDTGRRGFDRGRRLSLGSYVTLTAYEEELAPHVRVAYPKPAKMRDTLGEYLATRGLRQFRAAETEKFPHVTFFFNDYREPPFPGESREMAQSPKVATYDLQPEMSAPRVRDIVLGRLAAADCEDVLIVNFANGDMVGHTGKLDAAIRAVETVDACVGAIVRAALARGGRLIVTADHGNAEQMWDPATQAPHTAHTTYDVECILVDPDLKRLATGDPNLASPGLRVGGRLADVAPTMLSMMGLTPPAAMTGRSLIR